MREVKIIQGDSRDVLKTIADNSIDSVVTDPPYALVSIQKRFGKPGSAPAKGNDAYMRASKGFMSVSWDTGETAFAPEFWSEVMRVLKPGGHVVAASGTRTYHRLAVAIEDAGFEVRDMISWLYGSGFPKSHDVSKGIDKANGDMRPVIGDSPFASRKVNGSAGVNSVGLSATAGSKITSAASAASAAWEGWGTALKPACEPWVLARKPLVGTVAANVLAHGTGALNIDGCRIAVDPSADASQLRTMNRSVRDSEDGWGMSTIAGDNPQVIRPDGRWPANVVHDGSEEVVAAFPYTESGEGAVKRASAAGSQGNALGKESRPAGTPMISHGDAGSAARFFYSAKADPDDRMGSKHPTVKPIDLMRWLCRLVTPPGGVVLDPFAGSGSTGVAAMLEGFESILIEREADYVADIERKVAFYRGEGRLAIQEKGKAKNDDASDLPLFGGEAA